MTSFTTKLFNVSFLIYVISFALPAYTITDYDGSRITYGIGAFFMGAVVFIGGGILEWFIWLANPLFIFSIYLKQKQKKGAILFGWAAILVALSFCFKKDILASESGSTAPIEQKGIGYFLWVSSMVIWALGISFFPAMSPNK